MKHDIATTHGGPHEVGILQVTVIERDTQPQPLDVVTRAGGQVVQHADGMTVAHQPFRQMRSNKPGTAGDKIGRQGMGPEN